MDEVGMKMSQSGRLGSKGLKGCATGHGTESRAESNPPGVQEKNKGPATRHYKCQVRV
jgi:hypothetical protein